MKTRMALHLRVGCALMCLVCSMPWLRSAPGDENWDAAFGVPGVEGTISAMAVSGSDLYVGGKFLRIGGVAATNVAKWDGTNWSALGPGLGGDGNEFYYGRVAAVLAVNGELYAGGYFTNSGAEYLSGVVKWNGSNSWKPVSTNFWASKINALAWDGRYLYAGGSYLYFGNTNPNHIARWDGTNWSPLGDGVNAWVSGIGGWRDYGVVESLAASGGVLYVGGGFDTAGSLRVTNVARWNGSSWAPMGNGLPAGAYALAAGPQGLYSGGGSGVQRWDGSSWRAFGGNVQGRYQALGTVNALSFNGDNLFVGGDFPSAGGVPAIGLARWNGAQWSALGSGVSSNGYITALASTGNDLYVAGVFDSVGGKPSTNIARWRIPHELKIRRAADKALLSWPATGSNLWVESASSPSGPDWSVLSNTPGLHDGQCVVTNSVTDTGLFFRLRGR